MELEKHKGENILLIGNFNSRNNIWDRNANNNSRMGLILEDIINRHGLYITTNTDFTYQQSTMVSNSATESEYADDFKFWRTGTDFYHLLLQTEIAIINLQTCCLQWQISINISKTNYIIFYDEKTLAPPPSIPTTINRISLTKVKAKRALGIIIDEDFTFISHVEHIAQKCKMACKS